MNTRWSFRLRRTFFARRSAEECERLYNAILEEQFQLKFHGNLSLHEQNNMTSEDRAWWIKRLEKELKEKAERERKAARK